MKLRVISDIHLEFVKPHKMKKLLHNIRPGPDEIAVLAGDIGSPHRSNYNEFMEFMNANFKRTFVIAGNHEYYGSSIKIMQQFMYEYFESKQFANVKFLNNEYEIYDGYCFAGTTLWSDTKAPDNPINDVYKIQDFDYKICRSLYRNNVTWLQSVLDSQNNVIVITHHMPCFNLISEKYSDSPYNQWFCSDLNRFIYDNKESVKCWIYGHTHAPSSQKMFGIPFICNPIGYPGENAKVFFNDSVVLG